MIETRTCKRCGHQWALRKGTDGKISEPKVCPVCHSAWWNEEKVRK